MRSIFVGPPLGRHGREGRAKPLGLRQRGHCLTAIGAGRFLFFRGRESPILRAAPPDSKASSCSRSDTFYQIV
jgi:hypothetical protein